MKYRKITAIVRASQLENVEKSLITIGVKGISVTQVGGFGEYHDFYRPDMMTTHARIEIFAPAAEADAIARSIMDAAHLGQPGDGIVAVLPVERLYRIRTKSAVPDESGTRG